MSSNDTDSDENDLFRSFVKDITPINIQTIEPKQAKPKAKVTRAISSNSSNNPSKLKQSINDDTFFAFHLSKKERKAFKAGKLFFHATLDLHGQTVAQSEPLLNRFLNDCLQQNIIHAIIVHGQGHHSSHGSVLKPAVLYWLSRQDDIEAYCPAQTRDGGKGASYILISQ